ncbi:MAG: wax ester/triacylglycerol synthase family O-acyltransferase, partial [Deltaproteobacteria bacterium]
MQNVLSNVDLTWLRMEESTNPMMISVLLLFDEPVPFTRLKETVRRRLLSIPRMRQRVVSSWIPILGKPKWSEDPSFDLHNHLERVSLPGPGDRRALERFVGERMSRPLDRSRPLWKIHLIENVEGGSAILFRIHHAIADGIALMFLLLAMADVASEAEKNADPEENPL